MGSKLSVSGFENGARKKVGGRVMISMMSFAAWFRVSGCQRFLSFAKLLSCCIKMFENTETKIIQN